MKCRCLWFHVVYRDRFKNVSFWSFAVCDANWTQQIRLCLQHATVVTVWRDAEQKGDYKTVGRSRSLLKVTARDDETQLGPAGALVHPVSPAVRGTALGRVLVFVCLFVYVLKDVRISEYTNTVESRCQGFRRFVITHVILMFRPVVNSSDESGRRPHCWQVGFLPLLLNRRSLSARWLFSCFTRRDCTSPM